MEPVFLGAVQALPPGYDPGASCGPAESRNFGRIAGDAEVVIQLVGMRRRQYLDRWGCSPLPYLGPYSHLDCRHGLDRLPYRPLDLDHRSCSLLALSVTSLARRT